MYATSREIKGTRSMICCVHSYTRRVLHVCLQNSCDEAPGKVVVGWGGGCRDTVGFDVRAPPPCSPIIQPQHGGE